MATKSRAPNEMQQVIKLLQHLLAIELWRAGVSQVEIAKHLGIATGSANKLLKGVNRNAQN